MYNNKEMHEKSIRIALLFFLVLLAGCGGRVVKYVNPNANFSYIKDVAVLPFNNLGGDRNAGEKVRGAVIVDLMSREVFNVIEQGEVSKVLDLVLRSAGSEAGMAVQPDKEMLKLIGERMGVQAVIIGSVDDYGSSAGASLVSISLRMLDTSSGAVLWQVKSTASGSSFIRSILGIGTNDMVRLSRKAVKKALNTLL